MLTLEDRGAVTEIDTVFEEGEVVIFPAELMVVLETKVLVKVVGLPFVPIVVRVASVAQRGSEEMVGFDCDSVWNNVTL